MIKIERVAPSDHVVLFYDDEAELRRSAGVYLSEALLSGSVAIVIASTPHRAMLEDELVARGLDLEELHEAGSWLALDAAETLSRFVFDGRPDPTAFESVVGNLLVAAAEQGRPVCAYGEMVALLWEARQVNAAIELEGLWNDLGERTPFSLFCSYASASLSDPSLANEIEIVCSQHSSVVEPSNSRTHGQAVRELAESFPPVPDSVTRARHFVAGIASDWGLGEISPDVQLIVTELASNAIRHARSEFSVIVSDRASSIRVAVADESHIPPRKQNPAHDSSSGRGLLLVAALSSGWGVEQTGDGKVVWAEFRL